MAIPKRDENKIDELVERCEVIHKNMRRILRDEWKHASVLAEEARGRNNRERYIKLATHANDLCRAYNALTVTHHTALLLLKNTDIPFNELPPPYSELENAPDRAVRRWILDWIREARERLAE